MIKIGAFLTNINTPIKKTQPWEKSNLESLEKYFKRYDIPFYILDNNSESVDTVISHDLPVDLCKILMINNFVSTDIDYGLFLNTSTSIINIHNHIKNLLDFDTQYFSRMEIKDINNYAYLSVEKLNKIKFDFQNQINGKSDTFAIGDTSFMGLNKYFCQDYIDYANHNDINILNNQSLKNLLQYPNHEYVDDSFLLESFVQQHYKKYNIRSLHMEQINNIILNNTIGRDDITLEDIMYYYPIFFCHGDINQHSQRFVRHGLLEDIGIEEYNNIRHLRYTEMFYKYHSK